MLHQHKKQTGFTLVEMMLAVLLGLITVLVISQILVQAENRRRTISAGTDAQLNGALVLFTLNREIQNAGYGFSSIPDTLGCKLKAKFDSQSAWETPLAPVVIQNGSNGDPDTITILQAKPTNFATPITVAENHPADAGAFIVKSSLGIKAGDFLVIAPESITNYSSSQCALLQATHSATDPAASLTTTQIPHASSSKWNQSEIIPSAGFAYRSHIINMGPQPTYKKYAIDNNHNLVVNEINWTDGSNIENQSLYPQIINIQALYGKDTNNDMVVDTYDEITPTSPADWKKVKTIRLAVVARSEKNEGQEITTTQPLWDVGTVDTITGPTTATCGDSKCISLKVDHLPNWKQYRYKVYDTVIPLRNVVWNS